MKGLRRLLIVGLMAATTGLFLLALTGCGGEQPGASVKQEQGKGQEATSGEAQPSVQQTEKAANAAVHLRFASLSLGTSWYNYGASIAQLLRDKLPPGSSIDVLPFAGGSANTGLIANGKAEIGLISNNDYAWAYNGIAAYEGKPLKDIRVLSMNMDKYYVALVAKENYQPKSFEEIIEKKLPTRFVTLQPGTSSQWALDNLLDVFGLKIADIEKWGASVQRASSPTALADLLRQNKGDVWVQPVVKGHPTLSEFAASEDMKLLAVNKETGEKLRKYFWAPVVMPADTFEDQDADVPCLGFSTGIGVRADFPEELAYVIIKTIYENRDKLGAANASLKDFAMTTEIIKYLGAPLHPGAERYYKEIGLIK